MSVVNTNVSASIAQAALGKNDGASAPRWSSFLQEKINSAGDNAAGLAISSRMTAQIRGRSCIVMLTTLSAWWVLLKAH